jgi:hypothetical protein
VLSEVEYIAEAPDWAKPDKNWVVQFVADFQQLRREVMERYETGGEEVWGEGGRLALQDTKSPTNPFLLTLPLLPLYSALVTLSTCLPLPTSSRLPCRHDGPFPTPSPSPPHCTFPPIRTLYPYPSLLHP